MTDNLAAALRALGVDISVADAKALDAALRDGQPMRAGRTDDGRVTFGCGAITLSLPAIEYDNRRAGE